MEKYHAKKLEGIGDLERKQSITGWMKDWFYQTSLLQISRRKKVLML